MLLDAGDMLYPRKIEDGVSRQYLDSRARFIIKTQGKLGLQVWTPSLSDMRLGSSELIKAATEAHITLLASNLDFRQKPRDLKPVFKLKLAGISVGLIGLVGKRDEVPEGLMVRDPVAAAKEKIKLLKEEPEPADIIVVLSNMGIEADSKLAQNVDGVDFIIGAGDDRMILVPRLVGKTRLLQAYKRGEYLGLVKFHITSLPIKDMVDEVELLRLKRALQKKGSNRDELEKKLAAMKSENSFHAVLRPLTSDIPDDKAIFQMVQDQLSLEPSLP